MRSLFVTGTDTGAGKTVVTAAICVATGARAMKPAQTGSLRPADLEFVWATTGWRDDPDVACPYRSAKALAPGIAFRMDETRVDLDHVHRCFEKLAARGPVVVEGAGGLLVELCDGVTMAKLAARLSLPLVVACRPGLGTLNHTALTVEAALQREVEVLGIVISGFPREPGAAERTNPAELCRLAPLLGVIPEIAGLDVDAGDPGALARVARSSLAPDLGGTFQPSAFLESLGG